MNKRLLLASVMLVSSLLAQPNVTLIGNNYGWVPPGSPSYGIAQGSIFAIKGTNLGPSQYITVGPNDRPAAGFGGVTITIKVNGAIVQALNYYVGPQLAAVLPSNTPLGDGTLTVAYNGQTSTPARIKVVPNAFGVLTMDSSGLGTAKVCDYSLDITCQKTWPSLTNSARPGDVIDIWGSGLGPIANDATFVDLTHTVPIRIWIGGKAVGVTAAWRSTFVGLDFIRTAIPPDVTWGCYVSLVVQIGNNISNFTSLPVAVNGGACLDPVTGLSGDALSALTGKESFTIGSISLSHATNQSGPLPGTDTTDDTASAAFYRYHPIQRANVQQNLPEVSWGSCTLWTFQTDAAGDVVGVDFPDALDAGVINITSNGSTEAMQRDASSGTYSLDLKSASFYSGNVAVGGAGGAGVGSFNTSIVVPSGFQWSNRSDVSAISRANGQSIQWSNAAVLTTVEITGTSLGYDPTTAKPIAVTTFTCIEPAGPTGNGTFLIPSWVLLALPPSATIQGLPVEGTLTVRNNTNAVSFTAAAPTLDAGFLIFGISSSKSVTYQ